MKIYTRTGDAGSTGLLGGARIAKDGLRIEAYGTVDELNAALGAARALGTPDAALDAALARVQVDLFALGAALASAPGRELRAGEGVTAADIERLEREIDAWEAELPPLRSFVLPGGSGAAALLHLARTVCRRAERSVVRLAREESAPAEILVYLNRLSDLLFTLARLANHRAGVGDLTW